MARLTRTQKFAELRETLANDKEASIETKELSSYQNKLSNLTGENPYQPSNQQMYQRPDYPYQNYNQPVEQRPEHPYQNYNQPGVQNPGYPNQNYNQPVTQRPDYSYQNYNQPVTQRPVESDPRYTWTEFDETPLNNLNDSLRNQSSNPIASNSVFNSIQEMPRPVSESSDIAKLEDDDYIDDLINSIRLDTGSSYETKAPVTEIRKTEPQPQLQPQPQQPEPVVQPEPEVRTQRVDTNAFADYVNPSATVERPYVEPQKETKPVEQAEFEQPVSIGADIPVNPQQSRTTDYMNDRINDMFETKSGYEEFEEAPVNVRPFENVDRREPDHSNDTGRSYVNETIREVSDYNRMNGGQTIGQLTNDMVNEVRHHEEERPQSQYHEPVRMNEDEEFSNTVSMEIAKIIDDVNDDVNNNVKPVENKTAKKPVEEHPVLTKALEDSEEENVVEIKSLNELEAEATRDTVSNTIPFVVTNDGDEEIDDEDEEGSNTILNIILIVLIIILVVVLGLIVFYILKTKGII